MNYQTFNFCHSNNWTLVIHGGNVPSCIKGGVGFVVHRSLVDFVGSYEIISPHLTILRLQTIYHKKINALTSEADEYKFDASCCQLEESTAMIGTSISLSLESLMQG